MIEAHSTQPTAFQLRALVTAKRLWPVTREIIDWSRVDALIGDRS